MIHDLKHQGLSIKAIAERTGMDRKTVRKYLRQGLLVPTYGPREPRPSKLDAYKAYLGQRINAYPELSGFRLLREIKQLGYSGGYSLVTDYLREIRPAASQAFERRIHSRIRLGSASKSSVISVSTSGQTLHSCSVPMEDFSVYPLLDQLKNATKVI